MKRHKQIGERRERLTGTEKNRIMSVWLRAPYLYHSAIARWLGVGTSQVQYLLKQRGVDTRELRNGNTKPWKAVPL